MSGHASDGFEHFCFEDIPPLDILLLEDGDGGYVADCVTLPDVSAEGSTGAEAFSALDELIVEYLAAAVESGEIDLIDDDDIARSVQEARDQQPEVYGVVQAQLPREINDLVLSIPIRLHYCYDRAISPVVLEGETAVTVPQSSVQ